MGPTAIRPTATKTRRTGALAAAACLFATLGLTQTGLTEAAAAPGPTPDGFQITQQFAIATGNDDAMANATQTNLTSAAAYLHGRYSSSRTYDNYLRFTGVTLPADAQVTDVRLVFTMRAAAPKANQLTIWGELGAAAPFTSKAATFTSRAFSNEAVTLQAPALANNAIFRTGSILPVFEAARDSIPTRTDYAFKITGADPSANYRVSSYNGTRAEAPKLEVTYVTQGWTYTNRLASSKDDAAERGTKGAIDLTGTAHFAGYGASSLTAANKEVSAVRFPGVAIPENATVINSYIEFTSAANGSAGRVANVTVRSELGNAAPYTSAAWSISSRQYSLQSVGFSQAAFRSSRTLARTPDLTAIIDEARYSGWHDGDALAFLFGGDNYIGGVYEGGSSYAPNLVIEYVYGGPGPYQGMITDPAQINSVYINEVSTEGVAVNQDDWIELYNGHDQPVVLQGVRLWRDTNTKGDTFDFDHLVLWPNSYTILYADEEPEDGKDHLSFDLKKSGEIFLTEIDPVNSKKAGRTIDSLAYGEQSFGDTHGRMPDGTGLVRLFAHDTYGASNNASKAKYTGLTFSHERGVYPSGFDLTLTAPGLEIRYTLDGTTPSEDHGTLYTGPFRINRSSVVNAVAYDADRISLPVVNSYFLQDNLSNEVKSGAVWLYKDTINDQIYGAALADVPIVSISGDLRQVEDGDYVQSYFEYIPEPGSAAVDYAQPIGVKKFGNESAKQFNSGVAVRFKKDFGAGKAKYKFFDNLPGEPFGLAKEYKKLELQEGQQGPQKEWNLYGTSIRYNLGYNRYDETVLRRLANQAGIFDSHIRYVHYFLNGQYMGVKTMREDYGPHTFEPYFDEDSDDFTKVSYKDDYPNFDYDIGEVEEGDGDVAVMNTIHAIAKSKDYQKFKQYVDVDSLIRNQILIMMTDVENEMNGVVANNVANGGQKMMFNINDSDGAFANFGKAGSNTVQNLVINASGSNYRGKWSNSNSRGGPGGMFKAFSGDSTSASAGNLEFKTQFKDTLLEMVGPASGDFLGAPGAPLSAANIQAIMTEEIANVDLIYQLDAAFMGDRATIYRDWVANNPKVVAQATDRVKYTLDRWSHYKMVHTLIPVTVTNAQGGYVLTSTNASSVKVYYTTDGSDPMGANGVVSPKATLYKAGTVIPAGTSLTIRPFTTNNWGPLSAN
ncbi:MAG: chitobiase/beta-hexosaminidase C-terminal domain-containing protein [Bifidobacteriaceae bacterium]|jgi:hypothetical protein|nr:chitobiase/beta-hexosaminidase C-terminal domain-containing protein [Bifidobacteriaceae bacterium]